jgi:hypothetical protein
MAKQGLARGGWGELGDGPSWLGWARLD